MPGILEPIGFVLSAIIGLIVFGIYIFSIFWAYGDAEERGKSGCLVAILVALLSWPIGLIAWLIFRPDDRH